jgi:hypothetical protein
MPNATRIHDPPPCAVGWANERARPRIDPDLGGLMATVPDAGGSDARVTGRGQDGREPLVLHVGFDGSAHDRRAC